MILTRRMILIPYTYHQMNKGGRLIHVIRIMTEGGTGFWTEDSSQEALETNEIYSKGTFTNGDAHYFEVDTLKTAMDSMYDWTELPFESDMLCWRTFYVITDAHGNPWIHMPESIFKPILETILCLPKTLAH
jgi:hypothetical protein